MVPISQLAARPSRHVIHDKWWFFLAIASVALSVACWPDRLVYLRYDRFALMDGEVWRVVTTHLAHLNVPHLLLNLLGLLLICELQWGELPLWHGIGLLGFSGVAISACLWWLQPELAWYAGLSGVLHGLWTGCAFYGLQHTAHAALRSRLPYLLGAFLLLVKLLIEFLYGPVEYTAHIIGGVVLTVSHLYGALAGAAYVLTWRYVRHNGNPAHNLTHESYEGKQESGSLYRPAAHFCFFSSRSR